MEGHQTPQPPAAKRRRVEAAKATLRKPFRSPMLVDRRPGPGANTPASDLIANAVTTPARQPPRGDSSKLGDAENKTETKNSLKNEAMAFSPVARSSSSSSYSLVIPSNTLLPVSASAAKNASGRNLSKGTRPPDDHPLSASATSTSPEDPLEDQLATLQQVLDAELCAARRELNLVRQAALVEQRSRRAQGARGARGAGTGSGEEKTKEKKKREEEQEASGKEEQAGGPLPPLEVDADLRMLTAKWRAASRQAAEDLFELIRRRVEAMGGAKAWRESKRQARAGGGYGGSFDGGGKHAGRGRKGRARRGWGEDEEGRRNEVEDSEEDEGEDEDEDERGAGENEDDGRVDGEETRGGQDDGDDEDGTEFTMAMMLESLSIDPKMVGYDPVEDKWQD